MSKLDDEISIARIRGWADAFRAFHCVPENAEAFERDREQAHRYVRHLLSLLDASPAEAAKRAAERIANDDDMGPAWKDHADRIQRHTTIILSEMGATDTPVSDMHHQANCLWCERCKAWIETPHQCGAQYIERGDYFEMTKEAEPVAQPSAEREQGQ